MTKVESIRYINFFGDGFTVTSKKVTLPKGWELLEECEKHVMKYEIRDQTGNVRAAFNIIQVEHENDTPIIYAANPKTALWVRYKQVIYSVNGRHIPFDCYVIVDTKGIVHIF